MTPLNPLIFALFLGFWAWTSPLMVNAAADAPSPKQSIKLRLTKNHEVSAEVEITPDVLFRATESLLRKNYKVTFFNDHLRWIEAESRQHRYAVRIQSLTTGKSGITITAQKLTDSQNDVEAAKILALSLFSQPK